MRSLEEKKFYARQIALKEIGEKGQVKLTSAKVLVIGAGGLGHPASTYLAASGVGEITILDDDLVEASNLNRQIIFRPLDIGKSKSQVLAHQLQMQNPFIKVRAIQARLSVENIAEFFAGHDMILDCTDNFRTKFLIHDASWFFRKNLVQASIYQYEGQLQAFSFANEQDRGQGCMRCVWPQIPLPGRVGNCRESGVIGAVAGVLGAMQAMESIKMITGIGKNSLNQTTIFNLLSMSTRRLKWSKESHCPLCGKEAQIKKIELAHYEILRDFECRGLENQRHTLIDIRGEEENDFSDIVKRYDLKKTSSKSISEWCEFLSPQQTYLFICSKGIRSANLVEKLRDKGFNNCYSLFGGLSSEK